MQRYKNFTTYQIAPSERNIDRLSHVGFIVAIGLSAWFYNLRSTFGESAMTLFNLIGEPDIWTGSTWLSIHWFQHVLTILTIKYNGSLSLACLVFSTAPMVFLYGIFLIINYGFKRKNTGIFLLLLLLGLNQTFFCAVHTPLILAATVYLIIVCFQAIWQKFFNKFSWFVDLIIWASACLFLFIRISPNVYYGVIVGAHSFSFLNYMSSVAIGTFVISFIMAGYLALVWIYQKQFKTLILFSIWVIIMFGLIAFYGQKNLLSIYYEFLYFPFIAGIVGLFVPVFWNTVRQSGAKFWILSVLIALAVFGQLRSLPVFEERHANMVKLLQHAPKTIQKIAVPDSLQYIAKYLDPTYMAFETPLISGLCELPAQSIYFIPTDTIKSKVIGSVQVPSISANMPSTPYFHFSNPDYIVLDTPILKRQLIVSLICDFDSIQRKEDHTFYVSEHNPKYIFHNVPVQSKEVLHKSSAVFTGRGIQYAMTVTMNLRQGDVVKLSVWRKGSDNGHLVFDSENTGTVFWRNEQQISEPNATGWQKLSMTERIPKTEPFKAYVWNENYKSEQIYFDEFCVEIWRE